MLYQDDNDQCNKEDFDNEEGFDKIYSAIWKDGPLYYDKYKNEYTRNQQDKKVALKLFNLQNIINEFFIDQDKKYSITYIGEVLRMYGISQCPNTKDYIIVFQEIYCKTCGKKYTNIIKKWCESCQIYYFNKNLAISGNEIIDNIIQEMQLKINYESELVFEWIPYDQLDNTQEISKIDLDIIYSATWKNGPLYYSDGEWTRKSNKRVNLKYLYNSQYITKFLNKIKVEEHLNIYGISQNPDTEDYLMVKKYHGKIFGISQNPSTKDFIMILQNEYNEKCNKCDENYINTNSNWCRLCHMNYLKLFFKNLTSGNKKIDNLIQKIQLKISDLNDTILEFIPYNQFIKIKEIDKDDFTTIYSAIWKDGPLLYYDKKWTRESNKKVYLKLYDLQSIDEFTDEVEEYLSESDSSIYGISQNQDTKHYIIVITSKCFCESDDNIYSVIWNNDFLYYDNLYEKDQKRRLKLKVSLMYSQNIIDEVEKGSIIKKYGISQDPNTKDYIIVFENEYCEQCDEKYTSFLFNKWCKPCQLKNIKNLIYGTSGNKRIDKLIQEMQSETDNSKDIIFEWIPYNQFSNIKEIGKGGFATIYSATWKDGPLSYNGCEYVRDKKKIALKQLYDSQNITVKFLNEIKEYSIYELNEILSVYGISQNTDTKDYIMVLDYAEGGNLCHWVNKHYKKFDWSYNINVLRFIISGLKGIHENKMVHRDFHTGNILSMSNSLDKTISMVISDMGLCGKVDKIDKSDIYGVMPYVAPEVLRGNPYTQAADIYSFGMIMYFVATGRQPFANRAHDEALALDICKDESRPNINDQEAPECYIDLMKRCWNSNPDNRPKATEIYELFSLFYDSYVPESDLYLEKEQQHYDIEKQFKKADEYKESNFLILEEKKQSVTHHPQAFYTSQLLNPYTKNLSKYYYNYSDECSDCEI
ncbi:uncharacterized protein OCT59_011565 [Rhizophagus irregularis]|uniref:uncharacterized protein n=1 Tax=Rhizophagus irregularis TaxID=588596 RepID=UPI0033232C64|nr:hypothetical protein OCT59_011565 [Rhizophagus irregularis]